MYEICMYIYVCDIYIHMYIYIYISLPLVSQTLRPYPGYCCRQLTFVNSWKLHLNEEPLVS